ncbi:NAD-dependent epimerase/dehydratase family protein [Candidatus Bathyarchaeota archaeon]|nr:NAD-dependent epimerase/dehydratase family protein [Candidatus Bathyarchaeota archaeon]
MNRILITGGGGFIGSHLGRELYRLGKFVRIVDTKFDDYIQETYCNEKLTLDLREFENCLTVTKNVDAVFNLAANMGGIGFITSVGADVMHDNVLINANMLEASRQNAVNRYFFSSSACIYPTYRQNDPNIKGLKEEDAYPADPDNFYGWEKLYSEKMCEAYQHDYGLNVRIARYHNIYGPEGTYKGGREKSPAALCRKVVMADDPGSISVWGDGKQTRSYCYIDDAVRGTIMLMDSNFDRPLNIGSERLVTIDELADMIIKISGKRVTKTHDMSAPQGVRGRNADISLTKKVLGWEPKVTLEEGLSKTYSWIEMMCANEKEVLAVS